MTVGRVLSGNFEVGALRASAAQNEGIIVINKFALAKDVGVNTEVDVWSPVTTLDQLSVAETLTVTGTDIVDVVIRGIDNDWNLITDTVSLNGTDPAITTKSFLGVYSAQIADESVTVNTDDILGSSTTTNKLQFEIEANIGQTEMSHSFVPAGYTGFLVNRHYSTSKSDSATLRVQQSVDGGTYITKAVFEISEADSAARYYLPPVFVSKSRIKMRALANDNNTNVSVNYQLLLVRNDHLE